MKAFIVFAAVLAVASAGFAPLGVSSQYQAQDELGQYSYGYSGGPSAKSEVRTADGVTRGGYSYVDANGIVQQVQYISDPVNGFRVAATNLPVGPAAGPAVLAAAPLAAAPVVHAAPVTFAAQPVFAAQALNGPVHIAALPLPVDDTPEVKAAKAEHALAHAEALARSG